jgi:hypothetical protein
MKNVTRITKTTLYRALGALLALPALSGSAFADPIGQKLIAIADTVSSWVPALAMLGFLAAGELFLTGSPRAKGHAVKVVIGVLVAASARALYDQLAHG